MLSGDIIVNSIIQKVTEMLYACPKIPEKHWAWHSCNVILTSFWLWFSGVNKTVMKELHVMHTKKRFIKGFDNRKSQLKVYKMYIFPAHLPTQCEYATANQWFVF